MSIVTQGSRKAMMASRKKHSSLQPPRVYHLARRIVVTTDTAKKADEIRRIMAVDGLGPEVVMVPNRGRWPAMATSLGLDSVFVHKLDQRRV